MGLPRLFFLLKYFKCWLFGKPETSTLAVRYGLKLFVRFLPRQALFVMKINIWLFKQLCGLFTESCITVYLYFTIVPPKFRYAMEIMIKLLFGTCWD